MKLTRIPSQFRAGQWHNGNRFDARLFTDGRDTYPNNFLCYVQIRERRTGAIHRRRGDGRYMGNFSPVWVRWQGKSVQVEALLRILPEAPDGSLTLLPA